MRKIQGGYVLISVGQFANVCAARREGDISFLALRVWLAAHEQRAKRCTARFKRFTTVELAQLVSESAKSVQRALDQLATRGLISWAKNGIEFPRELSAEGRAFAEDLGTNPQRPIPVPRRLLRALFRHTRPAEVLAAIAHVIRCLFIKRGNIANGGLVKASWIASTFGIAERSAHSARKWLLQAGHLAQEPVHQLVMNRWGGKFLFRIEAAAEKRTVVSKPRFAPPSKTSTFLSTSNNQINNKPALAGSGVRKEQLGPPQLRNIRPEDLRQPLRLKALYGQALSVGWIDHSEANVRNFFAAALRATRAGGRVGALFVGIVKRKLWHHITQEQEARATACLKRFEEQNGRIGDADTGRPSPNGAAVLVSDVLRNQPKQRSEGSLQHETSCRRLLRAQAETLLQSAQKGSRAISGRECRTSPIVHTAQPLSGRSPHGEAQRAGFSPAHRVRIEVLETRVPAIPSSDV